MGELNLPKDPCKALANAIEAKLNNQSAFAFVDVNSVATSQSKSIGAEYVAAEQMSRYGFEAILQRLDFSAKEIDYATHLIIGRAVHPSHDRVVTSFNTE